MYNIRSYDMSGDQVNSLIIALEGGEAEKDKWLEKLHQWVSYRNRQMKISGFTKEWLTAFAIRTGAHLGYHEWASSDAERLDDWVYYQMEYTHGLTWDEQARQVVLNKYSHRPLLNEADTEELLKYLTEAISSSY